MWNLLLRPSHSNWTVNVFQLGTFQQSRNDQLYLLTKVKLTQRAVIRIPDFVFAGNISIIKISHQPLYSNNKIWKGIFWIISNYILQFISSKIDFCSNWLENKIVLYKPIKISHSPFIFNIQTKKYKKVYSRWLYITIWLWRSMKFCSNWL